MPRQGSKTRKESRYIPQTPLVQIIDAYLIFRLITDDRYMYLMHRKLTIQGQNNMINYNPQISTRDYCVEALSLIGKYHLTSASIKRYEAQLDALKDKLTSCYDRKSFEELIQDESPVANMNYRSVSWESISMLFEWVWRLAGRLLEAETLHLTIFTDAFISVLTKSVLSGRRNLTIDDWVDDHGGWENVVGHNVYNKRSFINKFEDELLNKGRYVIELQRKRFEKYGSLSGDQGEVSYPCGICRDEVGELDDSLQCDKCNKWIHLQCSQVTKREYKKMNECESFPWQCKNCKSEPPMMEDESSNYKPSETDSLDQEETMTADESSNYKPSETDSLHQSTTRTPSKIFGRKCQKERKEGHKSESDPTARKRLPQSAESVKQTSPKIVDDKGSKRKKRKQSSDKSVDKEKSKQSPTKRPADGSGDQDSSKSKRSKESLGKSSDKSSSKRSSTKKSKDRESKRKTTKRSSSQSADSEHSKKTPTTQTSDRSLAGDSLLSQPGDAFSSTGSEGDDVERCVDCLQPIRRSTKPFVSCDCVKYYCTYPNCKKVFPNHKAVAWSLRNHNILQHKLVFNYN